MLSLSTLYFVVTGIQFWISDYLLNVLGGEDTLVYTCFIVVSVTAPTSGVLVGINYLKIVKRRLCFELFRRLQWSLFYLNLLNKRDNVQLCCPANPLFRPVLFGRFISLVAAFFWWCYNALSYGNDD